MDRKAPFCLYPCHSLLFLAAGSAGVRASSSRGRPGSSSRRGSEGGGKDPTDLGSLRDSVQWGRDDGDGEGPAVPRARGLVGDSGALRKSTARGANILRMG